MGEYAWQFSRLSAHRLQIGQQIVPETLLGHLPCQEAQQTLVPTRIVDGYIV